MNRKEIRFVEFDKGVVYSNVNNPSECLVAFDITYIPCKYGHSIFTQTDICLQGLAPTDIFKGNSLYTKYIIKSNILPYDVLMKLDLKNLSISFDITEDELNMKYYITEWDDIMQYNRSIDIQNDELNKELYIKNSKDNSSILSRLYKGNGSALSIELKMFINKDMCHSRGRGFIPTVESLANSMGLSKDTVGRVEFYYEFDPAFDQMVMDFIKNNERMCDITLNVMDISKTIFDIGLNQSSIILSSYVKGVEFINDNTDHSYDKDNINAFTKRLLDQYKGRHYSVQHDVVIP